MKLKNIFAVALAVLALTSCDHDKAEDYPSFLGGINTAQGVSVSLPSTFTFDENIDFAMLPVTVSGNANGKVVVTVKVKDTTTLPEDTEKAIYGEHYNLTSFTVNIPEGEETGYIEMTPVWAIGELNDDRVFDLEIVSVQGATVGNQTCQVTIANVDDPYTSMFGKWSFAAAASNTDKEYTLTVGGPDPSDEDYYGKELYAYGLRGYSYIFLPLNFEYDEETGEKTLSIQTGTPATESLINFSGIGTCIVAGTSSDSGFGNDIPCTYEVDAAGNETITADPDATWSLAVMPYPALNKIAGYWGSWKGITLTRKASK